MYLTLIVIVLQVFLSNLEAVPVDGNVEVAGSDIDVVGETAVEATLPTSGNVGFSGQIHAKGSVKIIGSTCLGSQKLTSVATAPLLFTPSTLGLKCGPTFARNFKPSSPVIVPTFILPIFAPKPFDVLSILIEFDPKWQQLLSAFDFPYKMVRFNTKRALDVTETPVTLPSSESASNVLNSNTLLAPISTNVDATMQSCDDNFIDTSSLLPVSGTITITRRF